MKKPWEIHDNNEMNHNPTLHQESQPIQQWTQNEDNQINADTTNENHQNNYNSYSTNMYSPMGGMGYGGYGGYGGFGGMGMGMYGMGMLGMGTMDNQFLRQGLQVMESINFMVSSLGQIARTMETNAMGFSQLFTSVNNLGKRAQNPFKRFYQWIKRILVKIFNKILVLMAIKQEMNVQKETKNLSIEELELQELQEKEKFIKEIFKLFSLIFIGYLLIANFSYIYNTINGSNVKGFEKINLTSLFRNTLLQREI